MELASATSPQVHGGLVLVPVGSLEQHGPHLPLDTDTVVATAVARGAAERLDAWVAPAVSYGSSGEHQSFAGTTSIGTDVLALSLVELVRSMSTWASRVLFVNGHGGNLAALDRAVDQLVIEGHDASWVPCATQLHDQQHDGRHDSHAGRSETSLMLHLAPWNVRRERAEAGNTRGLGELFPLMRSGGVEAVAANGVLGDPTGATASEGAELLASMIRGVVVAADTRVRARS